MALANFAKKLHWVGVFFLFVASILMLFVTLSAPIINHLSLLRVSLNNGTLEHPSSVNFGTYGYCILNVGEDRNDDYCPRRNIGYSPSHTITAITSSSAHPFSEVSSGTATSLTRVMVLHPIITGLAFIALLLSLGSGLIGSLAGAFVAAIAWVLTLIALACDFSLFGIVRHHVNDDENGIQAHASFGGGIWLLLASFVLLFFGMVIVLFTCVSVRREKKKARAGMGRESVAAPATTPTEKRKKRFGIF
ncbi:hypothetical protein KC347_g6879 [Hortaea werneckii]|nr:hypothetical protein KC347_g6879 [Hortaea werneckii]